MDRSIPRDRLHCTTLSSMRLNERGSEWEVQFCLRLRCHTNDRDRRLHRWLIHISESTNTSCFFGASLGLKRAIDQGPKAPQYFAKRQLREAKWQCSATLKKQETNDELTDKTFPHKLTSVSRAATRSLTLTTTDVDANPESVPDSIQQWRGTKIKGCGSLPYVLQRRGAVWLLTS